MSQHTVICINCPLGCQMEVQVNGGEVTEIKGYGCIEGKKHARQEVFYPGRILTTTVKTGYPETPLLPVRSDKPLPKDKLAESMRLIAGQVISRPVQSGEVIINNILATGVNIIASRSIVKK